MHNGVPVPSSRTNTVNFSRKVYIPMSDAYKSTRRCYLIDYHSPQPPIVPLGHMNIEEYREFFKAAHIDSLMVYCKDHWGVTYYDSKTAGAQKHAGVKGDWIRTVRDSAKEMGIEFVAYYCIEYDEGAARRFPEWRIRRADGSPLIRNDRYAKWSLMCYQTGYREYALSQLSEIVENYHPDSLFLDIFGASLCYCPACRRLFADRFGYPLPETREDIAMHMADVQAHLESKSLDFYKELRERLKKIDPTLAITINFACHYPKELRDLLDYQYSEPLLRDNWFSAAYARDTAVGQYPMLAPGEASQVYNYDHRNKYLYDLSCIAAQGCRVGMYSGSQHVDGTLEHEESKRLGYAYAELEKMDPWLSVPRQPVKCIGIVQSDVSKKVTVDFPDPDTILRMKKTPPHTKAILGAMMCCEHAKIPYSILPEDSLTAALLAEYRLIILPEVYVVSPHLHKLLTDYVNGGGRIIVSGQTGLYDSSLQFTGRPALSGLLGMDFVSIHREYSQNDWSAYLKARMPSLFKGLLSVTTPPVSDFFLEVSPVSGQTAVLADFAKPTVACSMTEWVNWWSPPASADDPEKNGLPAILLHPSEKGEALYLAFDFFTMAQTETFRDSSDCFADLLRIMNFVPVMQNETATPGLIRTAFFETEDGFQIHQISTIPGRNAGETVPVNGGILKTTVPIAGAETVYPEHKELPVRREGACWCIDLPAFSMEQIILCKKP